MGPHHNFYRNVSFVVARQTNHSVGAQLLEYFELYSHFILLFVKLRTENACENHNNINELRAHEKKKEEKKPTTKTEQTYMRHEDEKSPKLMRIAREKENVKQDSKKLHIVCICSMFPNHFCLTFILFRLSFIQFYGTFRRHMNLKFEFDGISYVVYTQYTVHIWVCVYTYEGRLGRRHHIIL